MQQEEEEEEEELLHLVGILFIVLIISGSWYSF
jgi:hypothetical protein